MSSADKMSYRVILLLAVILLTLSVCQAKMTQNKAGDPQFKIYITLSIAGKTWVGATTGKISGSAKFLAKCHVFGKDFFVSIQNEQHCSIARSKHRSFESLQWQITISLKCFPDFHERSGWVDITVGGLLLHRGPLQILPICTEDCLIVDSQHFSSCCVSIKVRKHCLSTKFSSPIVWSEQH